MLNYHLQSHIFLSVLMERNQQMSLTDEAAFFKLKAFFLSGTAEQCDILLNKSFVFH